MQAPQTTLIAANLPIQHDAGMTTRHPDKKNSPEAQRARRLVEAMEFESSAAFAEWLGIDARRWHNFEAGYPISRDVGHRLLRKIPGLSFDWLFAGNPNGLSLEMARRLGEGPLPPAKPQRRPAEAVERDAVTEPAQRRKTAPRAARRA